MILKPRETINSDANFLRIDNSIFITEKIKI